MPLTTVRDYMVEGVHMWRALDYAGPLFLHSYRDACANAGDPECSFGVVTEDFTAKGAAVHGSACRPEGNLVLYRDSDAKPTWSSGTAGR